MKDIGEARGVGAPNDVQWYRALVPLVLVPVSSLAWIPLVSIAYRSRFAKNIFPEAFPDDDLYKFSPLPSGVRRHRTCAQRLRGRRRRLQRHQRLASIVAMTAWIDRHDDGPHVVRHLTYRASLGLAR